MRTIQTSDVMLVKSKSSDNYYFRLDGDKVIVVPSNIAAKWDTIDSVNIDSVHYEKRRNEAGELEDAPWDRDEVVGISSTEVKLAKATRNLQLREQHQVAATKFIRAKNEALKVTDLSDELKKELTALLAF